MKYYLEQWVHVFDIYLFEYKILSYKQHLIVLLSRETLCLNIEKVYQIV